MALPFFRCVVPNGDGMRFFRQIAQNLATPVTIRLASESTISLDFSVNSSTVLGKHRLFRLKERPAQGLLIFRDARPGFVIRHITR